VPYSTFIRPPAIEEDEDAVRFVADHREAAHVAFSFGRSTLLTTGSNHLAPYVAESGRAGVPLFVRVLAREESLSQCAQAGIARERTIAGRGPFSVAQNRQHIQQCNAGVLVTKDGGSGSGVRAKLEAARLEMCFVVVIQRPEPPRKNAFDNPDALVRHVVGLFTKMDKPP
jgi:precorrin-6A/cobalt-precorrin-6A reductase